MKSFAIAVAGLVLFQQAVGCDQKPAPKPTKISYPIRRFDREAGMPPDMALDTLTGQYCRTWDWSYKNPTAVGSADVQTLPTCLELFSQYPSEISLPPGYTLSK